ncbi:Dienelactone hydrolase [Thermomonospora echinospora]|uniref:Poly(ethylene terephthalate) hydrolase n=1 Tax=Thermomonospora echinospora TaxID=1992 RepID=A0A1H5T4B9_9ACTN|nr:alpha/beta hydrolase [Thermomonospora echinospora]SEF57752.1 Dienelactone hydrolase [Thermomonospora echinospora]
MRAPLKRLRRWLVALPAAAVLAVGVTAAPNSYATADSSYQRGPAPTEASVRADRGPFQVARVNVPGAGFGSGTIYYPTDTSQGTFGGVAVSPGFLSPEILIAWLGPRLASHGFVVITFTTNTPTDQPDSRGSQLLAALDYLTTQSPTAVRQRLDNTRLSVIGHSMGGGGALRAANDRPDLQAAVPLGPYHTTKDWSGVRVPTMIIGGQYDSIAPNDQHSERFYNSLDSAPEKAYLRVTGTTHITVGTGTPGVGKYVLSWLKRFVDDDTRYDQFLCPTPSGPDVVEYHSTCPHA